MQDSLALCLITSKADEEKARKLAETLKPFVDETVITVCDTDESADFKWVDDFSAARNFNFSKAKSDWILWLDADDTLRNPENLKPLVSQATELKLDGYWFMYEYNHDKNGNCIDKHWKAQLLRNDGHFTWKGKIHEDPIQLRPARWSTTTAVTRVHNSDPQRGAKSFERNLRILLKEVKEDPKEPRTKFYLGRTYNAMGEYRKAIEILQEYLGLSGWDDERYEARMIIASCYLQLGETDTALIAYNDGILEKESNPDAYIGKAHCYMQKQRWNDALYNFNIALELPVPDAVTFFNPMSYTRDLYQAIAWCYLNVAQLSNAKTAAEQALSYDKTNKDIKDLLALVLQSKAKHDLARSYVEISKFLDKKSPQSIPALLHAVPKELSDHELIVALRNRHAPPRTWDSKSLVVFCGSSAEDWTPDSQNKGGIGGSETAVIELTKRLAKLGWDVTVYNQGNHPPEGRIYDGVNYRNYWTFNVKDNFNVLWVWRLPELFDYDLKAKFKFLDLHDVMSPHDFPKERVAKIDRIFVKTNYHRSLFPQIPDEKFVVVGNGIDLDRFRGWAATKEPHRFVYTSSPNRGLDIVLKLWPRIREKFDDAELHVYYGWNTFYELEKNNPERMAWMKRMQEMMEQPGVVNHGRIGQAELARELLISSFWLYPTYFPEIDCITAKEMQAAGVLPITSGYAALQESVKWGVNLPGDPFDPDWQEEYLKTVLLKVERGLKPHMAIDASVFSWDRVTETWQKELAKEFRQPSAVSGKAA